MYGSQLIQLLDQHCLVVKVHHKAKQSKPWFDADCCAACRRVQAAERRFRQTLAEVDRVAWNNALKLMHLLYEKTAITGATKLLQAKATRGVLGEAPCDETGPHSGTKLMVFGHPPLWRPFMTFHSEPHRRWKNGLLCLPMRLKNWLAQPWTKRAILIQSLRGWCRKCGDFYPRSCYWSTSWWSWAFFLQHSSRLLSGRCYRSLDLMLATRRVFDLCPTCHSSPNCWSHTGSAPGVPWHQPVDADGAVHLPEVSQHGEGHSQSLQRLAACYRQGAGDGTLPAPPNSGIRHRWPPAAVTVPRVSIRPTWNRSWVVLVVLIGWLCYLCNVW